MDPEGAPRGRLVGDASLPHRVSRHVVRPRPTNGAAEAEAVHRPDGRAAERTRDTLLRITARRAEVLRELADGYTGREAAARIGLTFSGMRSHVEVLKQITGCSSTRELGRWWRRHRWAWLAVMTEQAGADVRDDAGRPR